jgi:hypothetical protein
MHDTSVAYQSTESLASNQSLMQRWRESRQMQFQLVGDGHTYTHDPYPVRLRLPLRGEAPNEPTRNITTTSSSASDPSRITSSAYRLPALLRLEDMALVGPLVDLVHFVTLKRAVQSAEIPGEGHQASTPLKHDVLGTHGIYSGSCQ